MVDRHTTVNARPELIAKPRKIPAAKKPTIEARDLTRTIVNQKVPGFDPIVWLAMVAAGRTDLNPTLDQRIACAKEVANYIAPKLRSTEATVEHNVPQRRLIIEKTLDGFRPEPSANIAEGEYREVDKPIIQADRD